MDGYIAVVAPHLPPSIVTPDALARIRAVAGQLPPCSLAGLELRLRDDQPNVDFFVRLPYVNPDLPSSVMASPAWRSVKTVCDAIADPSNPLHRQIRLLFLEFDLDTPPAGVPTPILFLELHTDPPLGACDLAAMAGAAELGRYRATLPLDVLQRCAAALPPGVRFAHMGLMPGRAGSATRLVIDEFPITSIAQYIAALGWRDPVQRLMPLVDAIGSIADPMVLLDLDVDTGVRDKIGVEFYVRRETDNLPRWRALFDLLADLGLASRDKAHTLLTWPGFTRERQDTGCSWADNLALGDLLFRGKATSMFWRTINHIKVAFHPRDGAEVKVYLGFGHNWFSNDTLAGQ